mgnify:FL=1
MRYFSYFLAIFAILGASRFIPHPPNFTSLLAISFYIPFLFGRKYIPAILVSFVLTDLIIGYHLTTHWTWGSVLIIGFIANYFPNKLIGRISGALSGAFIFYIVTNFGVWTTGMYGITFTGLMESYTLAIPFFSYSLLSTLIFSLVIELLIQLYFKLRKINLLKS